MVAPLPTGVSQAEADAVFADLVAKGEQAKQDYINNHCPPFLAANLVDYVGAIAPPLTQGASVAVTDAAGAPVAGSPGAAQVAGGVLTAIKLTV